MGTFLSCLRGASSGAMTERRALGMQELEPAPARAPGDRVGSRGLAKSAGWPWPLGQQVTEPALTAAQSDSLTPALPLCGTDSEAPYIIVAHVLADVSRPLQPPLLLAAPTEGPALPSMPHLHFSPLPPAPCPQEGHRGPRAGRHWWS